jgi:GH25 family lysozyme M1 (1,4-beta-N-acetylmuramidase)
MRIKLPAFYDVSHWKEIADFTKVSPKPALFGTKATEGTTLIDSKFVPFFAGMNQIGARRLAYHFHRKALNPTDQARHFCKTVRPYITKQDILALDVEEGGETADQLQTWLEYVMGQFPVNMVWVYSRKNLLDPIPMFLRSLLPVLEGRLVQEHPLNAVQMSTAQREFFRKIPVWTAGYSANPDLYDSVPAFYVPDQTKWGPVWAWQYSENGVVTGIYGDVDLNWMSPNLIAWLGGSTTPPPPDVVTIPFDGVRQVRGTRYGRKVYVTVVDPMKAKIEVCCVDNWPSVNCKNFGAQIAWNGDDWNRITRKVTGLAVSNGVACNPRTDGKPSLVLTQSGKASIVHENIAGAWNATSGVRYIVRDGALPAYLSGTEPQYTERHARSVNGVDAAGRVIHLTVDGEYPDQGVTLKEAGAVMLEFGAVTAFDAGSGGDSVEVLNGVVVNVPDDDAGGVHYERKVPQTILVYANEETTMPTVIHWTARTIEITKVKATPAGNDLAYKIPANTNIEADLESGNWLHVIIPSNYAGWVNKSSLTNIQEKVIVVDPPPPDPEPEPEPEPTPGENWAGLKVAASQVIETATHNHYYEGTLAWTRSVPK